MKFVDTHCHLTHFPKNDVESIIQNAESLGVDKFIAVACTLSEAGDCLALADGADNIWATVGIHPTQLPEDDIEANLEQVYEIAKNESKTVAIGEIGLDYYHDTAPHELQAAYFIGQLNIANQVGKPAIIHCRGGKNPGENEKAFIDLIRILEAEKFTNGVIHCFSGNAIEAEKIIDLGLMVSFTGIITYKNNEALRDAIRDIPLDRIMLETDSPYIAIDGHQSDGGHPKYVVDIAKKIAEIKNISVDEVARMTTENAKRFFGVI